MTKPKSNRRRLARLLFKTLAGLLVLFVLLLHGVSFLFSLHDRSMRSYASNLIADSHGHNLRYYELIQSDAEWNLVFIHGTPATAAVFGEQFGHPFPQANLFALDRPGFGASSPDARQPGIDDQANAVSALFSKLDDRKTILVGHSYGAPVALWTALKFTNRIAGILLIGGSVDPAQERTYMIQRVADWPVISWIVPRPLRQCNRELLTLRSDLIQLQPQLSRLEVPVVMLHGTRDRQVPRANVDYLRSQLMAAGKSNLFDAIVISNYSHFIPWQHPDAVEKALQLLTNHIQQVSKRP